MSHNAKTLHAGTRYIGIDPPSPREGLEPRCRHEMVEAWCSICKGLPDVRIILPGGLAEFDAGLYKGGRYDGYNEDEVA
jgi:hypothetical protein